MALSSMKKLLVAGISFVCLILLMVSQLNFVRWGSVKTIQIHNGYAVHTKGCKIPLLNPMDPTIMGFVTKKTILLSHCPYNDGLVSVNENRLQMNRALAKGKNVTYCEYAVISRPDVGSDDKVLVSPRVRFNDSAILGEHKDLFHVYCHSNNGTVVAKYSFATIIPRKSVEDRCVKKRREFEKGKKRDHFDIILFGLDSMSRSNSIRHLIKTRDILLNQLGALEFKGYHKIGDNTLPNVLALLTGKSKSTILNGTALEDFDFSTQEYLWNVYSRAGYRTFFGEDGATYAIFNYEARGFNITPTDYYLRPFFLEIQPSYDCRNPSCSGCINPTRKMFDWLNTFTETFSNRPHFALSFTSALTHDHMNTAAYSDPLTYQFVSRLRDSGAFRRNTIFIFFGDHGFRYGGLLSTRVGKLEASLPMMYMVLPTWFRERYPVQWRHLRVNAGRLTTLFDIHATLLHALTGFDEANAPRTPHGLSLVAADIPSNRTCRGANIPPTSCTCDKRVALETDDALVRAAADLTVDWLNGELVKFAPRCAHLKLAAILTAAEMVPVSQLLFRAKRSYKLSIRTNPGGAEFESVVDYYHKSTTYKVFPDLNRLNAYGNDSNCIRDPIARKYCYCMTSSTAKGVQKHEN